MKRIAVVFEGNIYRRLGVFNAVINRVKHLQALRPPYSIDVYMIQGYDSGLNRWLHKTPRVDDRPDSIIVDGITVNVRWFRHALIDSVAHKCLHKQPPIYLRWLGKLAEELKDYNLISAHDRIAGTAASIAAERYHIPLYITWHGASIYTDPIHDQLRRKVTCELLHKPICNFFVSKGLENCARRLTDGFPAQVLLNGAGNEFYKMDEGLRSQLRKSKGLVPGNKVVAFVGRFETVKNATLLPEIFVNIAKGYDGKVTFWTLGDGPQHDEVREMFSTTGLDVKMWGRVPAKQMPEFMNCIDVLVLPSSVEAISLAAIEAIKCGANAVASDVVGTAEAVGADNTVPLDDNLPQAMAKRAIEMLEGKVEQTLDAKVSWESTAAIEKEIYCQTLYGINYNFDPEFEGGNELKYNNDNNEINVKNEI
ncbi:MAG: glycosyltransferase [Muribaculaceae bacterium]|nr:glycosyltransferase [Muribaculaceae bacterium]